MTTARELQETIQTEAEKLGVGVAFDYGSKHRIATLSDGRATRRVTFSATPSRDRAVDLVRADVRRVVRDSAANNHLYHASCASLAQGAVNRFDNLAVIERAD
jgi:hypothetical protein